MRIEGEKTEHIDNSFHEILLQSSAKKSYNICYRKCSQEVCFEDERTHDNGNSLVKTDDLRERIDWLK